MQEVAEHIKYLDVSKNQLMSLQEASLQLQHLSNLQQLLLARNRLVDVCGLQLLTDLRVLNLSRNKITDLTPLEVRICESFSSKPLPQPTADLQQQLCSTAQPPSHDAQLTAVNSLCSLVPLRHAGAHKASGAGLAQQLHQQLGTPQHTGQPGQCERSSKPTAGPTMSGWTDKSDRAQLEA